MNFMEEAKLSVTTTDVLDIILCIQEYALQ